MGRELWVILPTMAKVPAIALVMHPAVASELLTQQHCERLRRICRFVPDPGPAPISPDALVGAQRLPVVSTFDALAEQALEVDVLLTSWGCPRLDAATIESFPRLRLIAHMGGSVKHFVDDLAWRRGVLVTNAADAGAVPVAEYTLGAILLANKQAFTLERRFARVRDPEPERLRDLPRIGNFQRTIGVIGASHVGRKLLQLLTPFEYRVLLYDPYIAPSDARALGAIKMGLNEVLSKADVLTVHAPLLDDTRGLIGGAQLALLRDGATLINTADGEIVDLDALEAELMSGRINAVLDVTDPQPLNSDSPLFELPNVFLTPQISGSLGAEVHRYADVILDELERYTRGGVLKHVVRRDQLPRLA